MRAGFDPVEVQNEDREYYMLATFLVFVVVHTHIDMFLL